MRTSRIAYRRRGKANLYPQDADLNWKGLHSYSAGVEKRAAKASAVVPFEQAAVQVSAQGAVTLGKRQAEELPTAPSPTSTRFTHPGCRSRARRRPGC